MGDGGQRAKLVAARREEADQAGDTGRSSGPGDDDPQQVICKQQPFRPGVRIYLLHQLNPGVRIYLLYQLNPEVRICLF